MATTRKVLIVDACSDKNAGDAAMQLALEDLIEDVAPGAGLIVAARFGANQGEAAHHELSSFAGRGHVEVMPGAYPTYVHFAASEGRVSRLYRKFGKALAALGLTPLLLAHAAGLERLARGLGGALGGKLYKRASESSFVIWNGRNIRRVDGARGYFKLVELLANPALVACTPVPKAAYGMSFWPVRSTVARSFIKGVMSRYDRIYVRETESLAIARQIGLANAELMPDLSFYHLQKLHAGGRRDLVPVSERSRRAAITFVAERELTGVIAPEAYVRLMADSIRCLRERHGLEVVAVRQVTYGPEVEDRMIERVREAVGDFKVLPPPRGIADLLDIYASCRMLLATRMHSAIFALSCATPVVALPYDWKGKWAILSDVGLPEDQMIPLLSARPNRVLEAIEAALAVENAATWPAIATRIMNASERTRELLVRDLEPRGFERPAYGAVARG